MEIILPKIALTMTSGVIVEWYKSPGDHVRKGEPILAFETDKTAIDLEADTDGVLREVRAQVGDEVVAGSVIGILEVDGSTDMPAVPPPARSHPRSAIHRLPPVLGLPSKRRISPSRQDISCTSVDLQLEGGDFRRWQRHRVPIVACSASRMVSGIRGFRGAGC